MRGEDSLSAIYSRVWFACFRAIFLEVGKQEGVRFQDDVQTTIHPREHKNVVRFGGCTRVSTSPGFGSVRLLLPEPASLYWKPPFEWHFDNTK